MKTITKKQRAILAFCSAFIEANGYPPTRKEIADEFSFKSQNASEEHLQNLARKGFINLVPRITRGIVLSLSGKSLLADLARTTKQSNGMLA